MRKVNLDAMHWYDTVHSCTVVLTERRMGYPKEITYAKAAIRAGNMWIRTERGRAGPVYPEQGLGQGRVEAPSDSNRYDAGVMWAMATAEPYVLFADTKHSLEVAMVHYADDRSAYSSSRQGLPCIEGES